MKKIISLLMIAVLIVGVVPAFSAGAEVFYNGMFESRLYHVRLEEKEPVEYRAFYPEKSGYYSFYSKNENGCDPYVICYDQMHNQIGVDYDSGYGDNFNYVAYLEEGKVYYFDVCAQLDNRGEAIFQVIIKALDNNITELELNKNYEVVPDTAKDSSFFEFTPESDGYYAFSSLERYAFTSGVLYDSEWNMLAKDEDSGVGHSFYLSHYLEKGKTYYYMSHSMMSSPSYSYTVKIELCEVVNEINILSYPERTTYYEGYVDKMIKYDGIKLEFVYTDGTKAQWEYEGIDSLTEGVMGVTVQIGYTQKDDGKYYIYVLCGYAYEEFEIEVIDCPVKSIEVVSHSKIECYENMTGWEYEDQDKKEHWFVYRYEIPNDTVIRINYDDGTSAETKIFTKFDDMSFVCSDNQRSGEKWSLGKNPVTIKYFDKECMLYVDVVENPIESITVSKAPDAMYFFEANVLDENGEHCQITPDDLSGIELVVKYKDQTSVTLTDKNWNSFMNELDGYEYKVGVYNVEQPSAVPVVLRYCGHVVTYDVSVVEKGDVDIDYKISVMDATKIQKMIVDDEKLDSQMEYLADADRDYEITVMDATKIQRFIAGLDNKL